MNITKEEELETRNLAQRKTIDHLNNMIVLYQKFLEEKGLSQEFKDFLSKNPVE